MVDNPFSELASQIYHLTKMLEKVKLSKEMPKMSEETFQLVIRQLFDLKRDIDILASINRDTFEKEGKIDTSGEPPPEVKEFINQLAHLKDEVKKMQSNVQEALKNAPAEAKELPDPPSPERPEKGAKDKFKDLKKRTGGKGWTPL